MARRRYPARGLGQQLLVEPEPWALVSADKPALREADVVEQVWDFLKWRGWLNKRNHVGRFVPSRLVTRLTKAFEEHRYDLIPGIIAQIRCNIITIGEEGEADNLFVHPERRSIWVEFKRPGGRLRPAQEKWAFEMEILGFRVVKIDNIDQFIAWYDANESKAA